MTRPDVLIVGGGVIGRAVAYEPSKEGPRVTLLESSLSFLGLGVQPPTPSWGGMLNDGKAYITVAWWLTSFPGAAIMLTVLGDQLHGRRAARPAGSAAPVRVRPRHSLSPRGEGRRSSRNARLERGGEG